MAKRELSNTLKNLKFMQRSIQREEKPKVAEEEEKGKIIVKEDGKFDSIVTQKKKCIVIMEGNPQPGVLKGRMSFQSYNPSIDKLNEAVENDGQAEVPAKNSGDGRTDRENGVSRPDSDSDGEHKRKLAEVVTETPYPNKSPRNQNGAGDRQPASGSRSKGKKPKHRRPDWNVLRPPKAEKVQS